MRTNGEEYRRLLVEQIKAISQDLSDMAEDLVGNVDLICKFEIHLRFDPESLPTIELVREHIGKHGLTVRPKPNSLNPSFDLLKPKREE